MRRGRGPRARSHPRTARGAGSERVAATRDAARGPLVPIGGRRRAGARAMPWTAARDAAGGRAGDATATPRARRWLWHPRAVRPTLFEFAGGEAAFLALAAAHHARCVADPELNHPFSHPGQHPQHVQRLAAYWAEVMGGPPAYTEGCGDQAGVVRMHSGNGDLGDLGARFARCFDLALDDAGLPDDPRLRAALRSYMRWAIEDVLRYPGDCGVAAGARLPRWGWDGLEA